MAPFDNPYSSDLTTKLSPLIEGQVPDFIQADHPLFVKFLKYYYEYLEAGELRVNVNVDNLLLELETPSSVIIEPARDALGAPLSNEVGGSQIVLESGSGGDGKFVVGETITGTTSKATAKVLVDDLKNETTPRMFITSQQQFQTGETITGGTSGATGTVDRYRANPVQTLQQLLEYANVDNTIYDFLDQLRESFMNAIPNTLADGLDKRNLIKNIRELYRAKGTSEGHKIFMRMLLGENSEVTYPNKFMMRASDGNWVNKVILRCTPGVDAIATELVNTTVTGSSSGATAVVSSALSTAEGGESIVQFELNPVSIVGTFTDGETISGTSTVKDVTISFTIRGMVSNFNVTNGGILYDVGDTVELDADTTIGNGEALAKVASVKRGSVSEVIIDDAGTNFNVGDVLSFTTTESSTNTKDATGFVSVIDGSLIMDGTDSSATDAGKLLVLESGSNSQLEEFQLVLDGGGTEATAVVNGATSSSTTITLGATALVNGEIISDTDLVVDGNTGTIEVGMAVSGTGVDDGVTVVTVTNQNTLVLSASESLSDNVVLTFTDVSTIVVGMTISGKGIARSRGITVTAVASQNSITISSALTLANNINIFFDNIADGVGDTIVLNGTDSSSTNAGSNIVLNQNGYDLQESLDTYGTETDSFALEEGTVGTGVITRIFVSDGGDGYSLLPTVGVTSTGGTGSALLASTKTIGAVDSVDITNQGFKYTGAPEAEFHANFVVKDVTGTFGVTNTLTTHTGTVKNFNATTKVLETTIEDVVKVTLETGIGGFELEQSLFDTNDRDGEGNLQADNITGFVPLDQLVDESGNNLVLDSSFPGKQLDYFVIEEGTAGRSGIGLETGIGNIILDGTDSLSADAGEEIITEENENGGDGFLIEEDTRIGVFFHEGLDHSAIALETAPGHGTGSVDPTNGRSSYDKLITEQNGDLLIFETVGLSTERYFDAGSHSRTRFVTEESATIATLDGAGDNILSEDTLEQVETFIVLDGTDSSGTDAGNNIVNESVGNSIVLDGTDADSSNVNDHLLDEDAAADGSISLDGTDANSADADANIINEDPIDFLTTPVTITDSGGATATISSAEIAKGTTTIGTQTETVPTYGSNIESLVGESLNRLQDSIFYQQFSYQIETGSGFNDYITQLKKAVHPAGFNVFGKVSVATSISAAIGTVGTSLGGGYTSDTDTFSPVLASTFVILFDENVQTRMGVSEYGVNNFDDEILLEDSNFALIGTKLILNGTSSEYISLEGGGHIVTEQEAGNIINESSVVIDGDTLTLEDFHNIVRFTDRIQLEEHPVDHTQNNDLLILDRNDTTGLDDGDSIALETGVPVTSTANAPSAKLLAEPVNNTNGIVNEDGGHQYLETAGKGGGDSFEKSIVSTITRKVHLPSKQASSLTTGLITIAENTFTGNTETGQIELEIGTATHGVLSLNGFEQINDFGGVNLVSSKGEQFLLEDFSDQNNDVGFSFDQFANYTTDDIVLNGTDGSSTNAGGNVLLDAFDGTGRFAGDAIQGEAQHNYNYFVIEDIIRPDRFVIEPIAGGELFGILQETDEIGSFRQEDGTTVAGTHGDEMLLEDETGVGRQNKISLEFQRIAPEDEVLKRKTHGFNLTGTIPPENFTNSDVEPFVLPADIESKPIFTMTLESTHFEVTNISLEADDLNKLFLTLDGTDGSSTDAGDNIILEVVENDNDNINEEAGTFINQIANAAVIVDTSIQGGFDSSQFKFDQVESTFDRTI